MKQEFGNQQNKQNSPELSYEYIRGLVEGEGCFTFCPTYKKANGRYVRVPQFIIGMHERDNELLILIRNKLGLKNRIYRRKKQGINNIKVSVLTVRDFKQLKNIIIPLFYKKLTGYKGIQFIEWLEKIGSDPDISDRYKSLYRLYKWGMYDKLPKFTEKFKE